MIPPPGRTARRLTALLLVAGFAGGAATTVGLATAPLARASTQPPWEPDPSSVGALTFYNAAGQQITGGSIDSAPMAAYVEGAVTVRAGDTKASLFAYTPVSGQTPVEWSGLQLGGSTTYPNLHAPAPLGSSTLPVETGSAADYALKTYLAIYPNPATSGSYARLYQLRLKTSAADKPANTTYDSVDIAVTGSTWAVVYPAPSNVPTVTVTATPSDSVHGQSVTYTATVSGLLGTAEGSVTFTAAGTRLCTATLGSGSGSCKAADAPVGDDTVTATYTPSSTYSAGSGTTSITVTKASTSTGLVSTPAHSVHGQAVTLTATVTADLPASGTPTGSVAFKSGTTTLGQGTLNGSGVATLTTSALVATGSPDPVSAVYGGDPNDLGSTGTLTGGQTVGKASTSTKVTSSPDPSASGTSVTFTATVKVTAPGGGIPTGSVTFKSGTTTLGSGTLNGSGVATLATSSLSPAGSPHPVTATYGGDANDLGSAGTLAGGQTVATNPGAPTQVSATAGDGSATVSFSPPGATGGVPLASFKVTSTDTTDSAHGGQTATGSSSPITVSGLTDEDTYTFTVTATNSVGLTGPASTPSGPVTPVAPVATTAGYDLVGSDGGVFVFPTGQSGGYFGSLPGLTVHVDDVVGIVPTNDYTGYDLVGSDGGVFVFPVGQPSGFFGSLPGLGVSVNDIVGIVPTNHYTGYDLVGRDGGVFVFPVGQSGGFYGSLPGETVHVDNIVGIAVTGDDRGYWLAGSTGHVYNLGDAPGVASPATGAPIVGIAADATSEGGWLVANNGSVYPFGDAASFGTLPSNGTGVTDVVSIVPTPSGNGYWIIAADGRVFAFGDATSEGTLPALGVGVSDVVGAVPTTS